VKLYYDLHLHSCLSPCGDMDMTPNNIVNMALLKELDVIALSDHNTARNVRSVCEVAKDTGLLVIPAIEVCTSEEVHMLCLFEALEECEKFGDYLYTLLPDIVNEPDIFGKQCIMNEKDEETGILEKLLLNAAELSIDRLLEIIPQYGGFAIPAHVDRSSYSIISNLGFLPEEYGFSCIEVKNPPFDCGFMGKMITDSDAHYLEDIAEPERTLEVEEKSIHGVISALRK
jgi:PHP family Zn ribbon phosphoesterase